MGEREDHRRPGHRASPDGAPRHVATNIFVSNQPPAGSLRDFTDKLGEERILNHLASCLVTKDAYDAALRNDYETFPRARSETLHRRALELAGFAATP